MQIKEFKKVQTDELEDGKERRNLNFCQWFKNETAELRDRGREITLNIETFLQKVNSNLYLYYPTRSFLTLNITKIVVTSKTIGFVYNQCINMYMYTKSN